MGMYYVVWSYYDSVCKFADQIARILVEFLEVAITAVVFLKGVYPSGWLVLAYIFFFTSCLLMFRLWQNEKQ